MPVAEAPAMRTGPPPAAAAVPPPKPATIRVREPSDVVRAVQRRLVERGFAPGYPDGVWGPHSEAALRDFQQTAGLPATGHADAATLARLFDESPDVQRVAGRDDDATASATTAHGPAFAFGAALGFVAASVLAAIGLLLRRQRATAS